MLKDNNINPKCDIVLYASSLFICDCAKPKTVPITKDNKEPINSKLYNATLPPPVNSYVLKKIFQNSACGLLI
ncbi:unnamed protein product [Mycena citricolor]|uniref:Uncharacterized protein n=1 Tax=Mycena citricolor TaxID=2018698 RepID=A0AAD2K166_9AGAR|nr:unnamed protein product [Mycena citricolor]CAK5273127.1 unnamed protein product [Mycena citricolor]CAK5273144.1 unnamed protein product [Mycena citricolor]CAK5273201.1 unnamed protein product [Mycena citricolor]CAK5273202.1 unnamed protein product [Mycena citricolor]